MRKEALRQGPPHSLKGPAGLHQQKGDRKREAQETGLLRQIGKQEGVKETAQRGSAQVLRKD